MNCTKWFFAILGPESTGFDMRVTTVFQVLIFSLVFAGSVSAQPDFASTKSKAAQGDAFAQLQLGSMYADGLGVAMNYVEAVKWFKLAADQGNASAQYLLGDMYVNGHGVPQNYLKAYVWFSLSAAQLVVGTEERNIIGAKLTPSDLSIAQAIATKCFESNYKDCE